MTGPHRTARIDGAPRPPSPPASPASSASGGTSGASRVRVLLGLLLMGGAPVVALAAPLRVADTAEALATAMQDARVVILGEVHDNGTQHALRAAALRKLVEGGARPALAFEQFDREHQAAIDAARRARPRDADYVIAQGAGAPSWNWAYYKPFVVLALEYDLPIVAANLSRADAVKVAMSATAGEAAVAPAIMKAHESAVEQGHCNLLPAQALPGMARAQIARDRVLAESIAPHAERGVVLLTGNGHARNDIGAPQWLPSATRAVTRTIGLLEKLPDAATDEASVPFDAYVLTEAVARADPCAELARRMKPKG